MIRLATKFVRNMRDPAAARCAGLPQRVPAHAHLAARLASSPPNSSSLPPGSPRRIAARAAHPSHAFTIVELLVVVAIIIVLLGILIVAMSAAARSGQRTRTIALMGSIKQALIRFKEDVGYYPPVLGVSYTTTAPPPTGNPAPADLRRLFPNSVPSPNPAAYTGGGDYINHMQTYYSTCTLADYLIGYGNHREDGYGHVAGASSDQDWDRELPPLGIRHPGPDGVWGASQQGGMLDQRMKWQTNALTYSYGTELSPFPLDQGKVLGPYLELKDERLLAGVNYENVNGELQLKTYFQGDVLPAGLTWETIPKAIVDYWGQPIRYYRRPYPPGALGQSYRSVTITDPATGQVTFSQVPTLSDVYVLRPREVKPGSESPNPYADQPTGGEPSNNISSRELDAAEFALLSAGPDLRIHRDALFHKDNADNLVEVGP